MPANSSKKILLVTDAWHPQVNGVVRTLEKITDILKERGHDVRLITPEQFKKREFKKIYPDMDFANPLQPRQGQSSVWRTIKDFKPDHIHIATLEAPLGFFAYMYCVNNKLDFTAGYHTRFPEFIGEYIKSFGRRDFAPENLTDTLAKYTPKAAHEIAKVFYNRAKTVLVPTTTVQNELREMGYRTTKLWTHGVDSNMFSPDIEKHPEMIGLEKPVFLNVGRVSAEKNINMFLQADLPGTKVLVGGGPELLHFKEKYKDDKKVIFLGMKQGRELSQCYASSDVFVFPSVNDTFGLVQLEALASGTPVAAFNVPGPKDVIVDPKTGVLAKEVNPAALAKAAKKALELNRDDCRNFAVTKHSWDLAADILLDSLTPTKYSGRTKF